MLSSSDILAYGCRYAYPDTAVMPATRRRLGIAIASAERAAILHENVNASHLRVMTTSLYDEAKHDPLCDLTVVLIDRRTPRAGRRKRYRVWRRIWRRR